MRGLGRKGRRGEKEEEIRRDEDDWGEKRRVLGREGGKRRREGGRGKRNRREDRSEGEEGNIGKEDRSKEEKSIV